ncbi:hypothetical protein [Fischerella sp.]|nr:hypothetical protein [Fischerella sp.]
MIPEQKDFHQNQSKFMGDRLKHVHTNNSILIQDNNASQKL